MAGGAVCVEAMTTSSRLVNDADDVWKTRIFCKCHLPTVQRSIGMLCYHDNVGSGCAEATTGAPSLRTRRTRKRFWLHADRVSNLWLWFELQRPWNNLLVVTIDPETLLHSKSVTSGKSIWQKWRKTDLCLTKWIRIWFIQIFNQPKQIQNQNAQSPQVPKNSNYHYFQRSEDFRVNIHFLENKEHLLLIIEIKKFL